MTLHEVAEQLRKVAYDMDEASRRWDANDVHVVGLDRTIANLTGRVRVLDDALGAANLRLIKLQARLARRKPAKKAKR